MAEEETIAISKKHLIYAIAGIVALGLVFAVSQGYITIGAPTKNADIKSSEQASAAIVDVGTDVQNLDKTMADIESGLK